MTPVPLLSSVQSPVVSVVHPLWEIVVVGVVLALRTFVMVVVFLLLMLLLWFGAPRLNPPTTNANMKQQTIVKIRFRMTSTYGTRVRGICSERN